jgi:hypothetical protein
MKRASMAAQEKQQRLGYQEPEVRKEQHCLMSSNVKGTTLLEK